MEHKDRVRNPIDAFLLDRLEAVGLGYAPEAGRNSTGEAGLPRPHGHSAETGPDARIPVRHGAGRLRRLLDRLLDSEAYGERWAQVWLDLAGYADSEGVIDEEPVAAARLALPRLRNPGAERRQAYDEIPHRTACRDELLDYENLENPTRADVDTLAATGFLRMTPDGTYGSATGSIAERFNVVADEMEVLSSAVMESPWDAHGATTTSTTPSRSASTTASAPCSRRRWTPTTG